MGVFLAIQAYEPAADRPARDKPMALSAESQSVPPVSFEAMLDPPWMPSRELEEFHRDDLFDARFANLEQKKLVAVLDLPGDNMPELTTSSLREMPPPAISYGEFTSEMKLALPVDDNSFVLSNPAPPGLPASGRAHVIDAATLVVGSKKLHLAGVELPEEGRECKLLNGIKGDCRKAAVEQLDFFLRWRTVSCDVGELGGDGIPSATCRVGMSDIGEWLVRRGWAVPQGNATQPYHAALLFAQSYRLGQWRP